MRLSALSPRRAALRLLPAVLVLVVGALSLAASAQTPQLSLVSTAWPPFTNPAGQPRFALDLVEAALGRIGLGAKTTIVSAAQYTPSMLSGSFDGSGAAWKDAERERFLVFSQPYLENRLVLVGRRGEDVSAATLQALKGKRVAIVEGYSYGEAIDNAGPVFVRSSSEEDSLTQLLNSRVDYTLMDALVVQHIISSYPKEAGTRLAIGTTPLVTRGLYLAIQRTRPDAESIVTRFNAQLRNMIADRTYHRLLHVEWILADVNGDGINEYVPQNDQPGSSEPKNAYALFATPAPAARDTSKPGFYVGGNTYSDWASVPDSFKVVNPQTPDPRRSTGTIFQFKW